MKTLLAIFLLISFAAQAEDIYIAQNAAGLDSGADASNTHAVSWFASSSNWGGGAGKISSGDTVLLVGTLTNALNIISNGLTLKFTEGAKISMPAGEGNAATNPLLANYLIYCVGRSDVTIDGQGTGVIECADNGSELGHQYSVKMLQADSSSNLVVRGLTFRNGYVHTLVSDAALDEGIQAGIKTSICYGTWTIQNCVFSNVCWAISISASGSNLTTLNVVSNYFVNFDHGVALGSGTNQPLSITVASNYFGTTANWDTTANRYHHDGIHYYGNAANPTQFVISHNTFAGDWGSNNTAHVYLETGPTNVIAFNNVFLQWPGNKLNNGFWTYMANGGELYNNTFLGSGDVTNSIGLSISGTGLRFVNNIVSGVTTFLSSFSVTNVSFAAISNNIYANQLPGGNATWRLNLTNYNTLDSWQSVAGDDQSSLLVSADVNSDGTLAADSPAVDSGGNLASKFTTDKSGKTRTSWDIGAYEFAPAVIIPTHLRLRVR